MELTLLFFHALRRRNMTVRAAALVSGVGSLRAFATASGVPFSLVVGDRPCAGLDDAAREDLPVSLLLRDSFGEGFDRDAYSHKMVQLLQMSDIDLVVMAGFDTIFSQPFFDAFEGRVTNNHPSLLPAFKGHNAVRDALAAGVKWTGCTIHYATLELDAGPIIAQQPVPVEDGDTEETLHERIKKFERPLLVKVLRDLMDLPPIAAPQASAPDAPYCMECGVQMMKAGSLHACPSCGSTSRVSA